MATKKKKDKYYRQNIVWGEYDEMIKKDPTKSLFRDLWVFRKIDERDRKRINRYFTLCVAWWFFVGAGLIISLIVTLFNLHEILFPLGADSRGTFLDGTISLLFFFYFLLSFGSIIGLLKIKDEVFKEHEKEVYSFFDRRYEFAKKKFEDWKVSQLEGFLFVANRLRESDDFSDMAIKEEIWAMQEDYEELIKKIESKQS